MDTLKASKIREFWRHKATSFAVSSNASWGDLLMRREVSEITNYVHDGENVLDVGCANGYSSVQFAERKNILLTGIDYAPEMVRGANRLKKRFPTYVRDRVQFRVGNILTLDVPAHSFDVVISTRVLCNLVSEGEQKKALLAMWRALKPRGILLLSEPTVEGLKELNRVGKTFGLPPLQAPWHNLYLDEKETLHFARRYFNVKINYFSSTYYFFSRILYRFLVGGNVSKLRRDGILNRIGVLLPSIGTFGIQRLYIMKKRETRSI